MNEEEAIDLALICLVKGMSQGVETTDEHADIYAPDLYTPGRREI